MTTLVQAAPDEVEECYHIIDEGRQFQKQQGFTQWTEDYPNLATIRDDISTRKGYAVKVDGALAGYMCIDFSGEPAYADIDGEWHSSGEYAVVHRMAFSSGFRGMGLSDAVWKLIEEHCLANGIRCIRVDTDFPNKRMQHILEKNGFERCGIISFQGSGKIAYDKLLSAK